MERTEEQIRTGWVSLVARFSFAALGFEAVSGLAITLSPFHALIEWGVLLHTLVGLALLLPIAWYFSAHWLDYRSYRVSNVVVLGYVAVVALAVCVVSGIVVTVQGLFAVRMSNIWRQIHLISTLVSLAATLPHVVLVYLRVRRGVAAAPARGFLGVTAGLTLAGVLACGILAALYSGTQYVNEFPEDYALLYGEDRPFAPSMATTTSGGAFDARSLAGSESCGTAGCHEQILAEWKPSAHRYAAMDAAFQKVQSVMAEQNGPESTRYCGGCHDPISLFSGTKNIMVENLTGLLGYNEGVSCLSCHSIRETDLQGNANYVVGQPSEYLWQWAEVGLRRRVRDFLIRTYPDQHNGLSKRAYKSPEYCAACHKQFIDEEVNQVGWVQLQNQYDNWKASHWNQEGDPQRTVECRECHMPLVASNDPAAGDAQDYNRSVRDGKHRSHRFIAANGMMPAILELEGWQEQVELTGQWLRGEFEIPEIRDKWASGAIVELALETPEKVVAGETMSIRVVLTSNKVGHDFPTGPLDIIQSWVELHVTDEAGNSVFATGRRDEKHFIEPGSFMFKVEPVDQYGNLIDRHNLWEMVGVRFRRALFPGYSDSVEFTVGCPSSRDPGDPPSVQPETSGKRYEVPTPPRAERYTVTAILNYRKVDQFLLNFLFGEDAGLTAPVVELDRAEATILAVPRVTDTGRSEGASPRQRAFGG